MTHFPLPDEFYDDPLYDGISDAGIALYARAASFSARHTTDGFVSSSKLPSLTTQVDTAPEELVRARVWRRARGGFQFVVWPRECTRAYVEAKREAWRRRQANYRSSDDVASRRDSRVSHGDSHPESHPSPVPVPTTKEQKTKNPPASRAPTGAAKGTRIPDDFAPTDDMIAWARQHTPSVGRAETDQFRDYWTAASGRTAAKRDWPAAWRYWMRKAQTDRDHRTTRPTAPSTDDRIAEFLRDAPTAQTLALQPAGDQ
jgi:hypothetical protein